MIEQGVSKIGRKIRNMQLRVILVALLVGIVAEMRSADYEVLRSRSERFFGQQEWASASAMYDLMIEQQPKVVDTYCHAIVSAGMQSDTLSQIRLMRQSIKAHIAFDSIFKGVKRLSFQVKEGTLYEQFLNVIKRAEPWLTRSADRYLLDYYVFRNDAQKMIDYSKRMLSGLPNDEGFLSILAQGYMLNGQYAESVDTYRRILEISPNNYDALLRLGLYYDSVANESDAARKEALKFLQRACKIKATPFINAKIARLSGAS